MKIGMVCRFPPEKDGIAATYINLVDELRKQIRVITIGTQGSDADYKLNFRSPLLYFKLKEIIKKEKLDLLHVHHIAPFYSKYFLNLNLVLALKQKIPVITTLHEVHTSTEGIRGKILAYIQKNVVFASNGIIVHTPRQKKFIDTISPGKSICIFYGIDTSLAMKKRKGRNLLFFGILSRSKGLEYLINAMKKLPGYNLRIVAALPPPLTNEYKNELNEKLKGTSIEFIVNDWTGEAERKKHYSWANILIVPYTWAPYQSAVITDAAAYRLPLVVTKVGSVWELPSYFSCGAVIKSKSVSALVVGINKVYMNYGQYLMGINRYAKQASWKISAEMHIKYYMKVINEHKNKKNIAN